MSPTAIRHSTKFILISFFCLLLFFHPANAQISDKRLEELQSRYDWGSIYLSYGTIPDIIQVLDNQIRLQRIKTTYNSSPPSSLVAFFSRYKSPTARRSIMLFQLNFSAKQPVAGYLTGSDLLGTINKAPLTAPEVLSAADWIDLYLTHVTEFSRAAAYFEDAKITLADAWLTIKKVNNDPFASEDRISSLLITFRQLQIKKAEELESLKTKDAPLYQVLKLFASQYDATTTAFIQDFLNQATKKRDEEIANETDPKKRERLAAIDTYNRGLGLSWYGWHSELTLDDAALSLDMYQDNLKLRIYQAYQQLLDLEGKDQGTQPAKKP